MVGDEVGGLHEDLLHGEAAALLVALRPELRLGGPGVRADRQFTHVQVVGVVLFGELRVIGGVAAALDGELHVGGVEQFAALVVQLGGELHWRVFGEDSVVAHPERTLVVLGHQEQGGLVHNLVEGVVVLRVHVIIDLPRPEAGAGDDTRLRPVHIVEEEERVFGLHAADSLGHEGVGGDGGLVGAERGLQRRQRGKQLLCLLREGEEHEIVVVGGRGVVGHALALRHLQSRVQSVECVQIGLGANDIQR